MEDQFNIYVDQLRKGQERQIEESLDPAFLDIQEAELVCKAPVNIKGKAYLAEDHLVIHFSSVQTEISIPCSICNQPVTVTVKLHHFYHSKPLAEIRTRIYSFKEALREEVVLEFPRFTECGGSCPERQAIAQYLVPDQETPAQPNKNHKQKKLSQ